MDENTFDSSSLKAFLNCQRKYFWRYVEHFQPVGYDRPALDFGTAIHEGLRVWYEEGKLNPALDAFHDLWDERWEDTKRTHEKGEELLRSYVEKYPDEPFEWISPPEQVFKVKLFDTNFVGRFDGVIKFQSMPLIIDHKTATRMGQSYFYRFRPDMQMSAYVWAARQLFEEKIMGAYINVLYFTKTKMKFEREIIPREDWELEEFLDVASSVISQIQSRDRDNYREWTPNWSFCDHWGTCKFRDLCVSEDPYRTARGEFEREEWDPLEEFDIEKKLEKQRQRDDENQIHLIT